MRHSHPALTLVLHHRLLRRHSEEDMSVQSTVVQEILRHRESDIKFIRLHGFSKMKVFQLINKRIFT